MSQHTIRYYSKSSEEYENGNGFTCCRCGRQHRHAVEIDGQVYGKTCAVKVMSELQIIDTTPAPSKRLSTMTVTEIKNIVHPFTRRTVATEFVNYYLSKLSVFTANHALSILEHWDATEVIKVSSRQDATSPRFSDWQIIGMLKPLFN